MSNPEHLLFLGAGASYGSETDKSLVPPLTSDLFDQLLQFDGNVWGQVPDEIAKVYRNDFEAGMLGLAAKMPHALPVMQRSMGAFFFRFAPTPSSQYIRLANKMKSCSWNGAIATLNYERMLLLALNNQGCAPICGSAVAKQIEVCLPHGCCNLFCESVRGLASAVSMAGMNVTTNGPVICVDHPDAFWPRIRNDAFPPVMSYFEPSKFTTSGADFIEAQRRRLAELIASAKSIAVVGIQVREQDSHIWSALGSTDARIYYCSGTRGAQAFKEWHLRARSSKTDRDSISAGYWDTDFDAISDFIGMTA
jgi:hypothetical protein